MVEAAAATTRTSSPSRAKHSYGDGFGAGRGHQGQDVFAKCGNKLVAVRKGRVQTVDSHSSAGNYIVIDGKNTGIDTVYMHLKKKAIPREGSNVGRARRSARSATRATRRAAISTSRSGPRPATTRAGSASSSVTKALKSWDKYS